jgi:hypothetical protein
MGQTLNGFDWPARMMDLHGKQGRTRAAPDRCKVRRFLTVSLCARPVSYLFGHKTRAKDNRARRLFVRLPEGDVS